MKITFCKCNCENRRVDKTNYLTGLLTLEGAIRDETNVIDPTIVINSEDFSYYLYNYCYISLFKRYYYITEVKSIRTDLWEIIAHCDVLYTWRAELSNQLAIIEKTGNLNDANLYIDDGSFVMDSRKNVKVIPFPNPLDEEGEYILICGGGTSNAS